MPKINHEILFWARETAGLELEQAARKLMIKDGKTSSGAEKLAAYEAGTVHPSRALLLRMSKAYRRPLLTFYLDTPPRIGDRGEDFRTLPEHFESEDIAYVDAMIRDIKARQSLMRETLVDEDEAIEHAFVGSAVIDQGVSQITQTLREMLNIDLDDFRAQGSYGEAFKYLRKKAEAKGIFVLLKGNLGSYHTNIDLKAFRGFALSDKVAPFIVINDRDAKSAWCFTLLHEIVHILLGQTGVSGSYAEKHIEKFCNDVASEFLLPDDEFVEFNIKNISDNELADHITKYALSLKVSSSHVAYRLYRKGALSKVRWEKLADFYRMQWVEQKEQQKIKARDQKGGPSYYVIQKFKLGALAEIAQRLNSSGALSTTKAGILLDIRPIKVHRLFESTQIV
ncbi:MAG: XRE family transcriptional regulator [Candidatus Thiodiazotropha sp.]